MFLFLVWFSLQLTSLPCCLKHPLLVTKRFQKFSCFHNFYTYCDPPATASDEGPLSLKLSGFTPVNSRWVCCCCYGGATMSEQESLRCSSARNRGGVQRVEGKLRASVEKGDYYEAHQMYRTLFFRWDFVFTLVHSVIIAVWLRGLPVPDHSAVNLAFTPDCLWLVCIHSGPTHSSWSLCLFGRSRFPSSLKTGLLTNAS